jgi:DNA polymerase-3 subunit alpha
MVKIIDRKLLGNQSVYDIGVAKDHNFILANGLVTSNCFNKSHSTAYAYVTYQTAYLKANYPVEYMTALLTASSDSQDKIEKYRENCQRMGIQVVPPNINLSRRDFTPTGNNILFGLSAVKNLGEAAIENILQAREEVEGGFNSFADFCNKVDLRVINSRTLETLIYCGAFDEIEANRKQLITNLELIVKWAQNQAKEKESGQLNIFGMLDSSEPEARSKLAKDGFNVIPSGPKVEDFSIQEKLKFEKEYLGFYVSEHPLKSIKNAARILSPINLHELSEQRASKLISTLVILTAVKSYTTKKGDQMAFIQIEDISGATEGVVFPSVYDKVKDVLQEDNHLIIWGKVDKKDADKVQLIVEDAAEVETVKMVMIKLSIEDALNQSMQNKLKSILQEQSGDKNKAKVPVLAVIGKEKMRQVIRLGNNYWVQNDQPTINALNNAGFNAYSEYLIPVHTR